MNATLRRWLPHPLLSAFLVLTWMLLNNSFSAGHFVLGLILGLLIPKLTSAFWPEVVQIRRPAVLARFVAVVLFDILVANMVVSRLILGRSQRLEPGFFHVPLDLNSPLAISLLANTISLTPGTVSCDLSDDQRTLLVHALHVEDHEADIAKIKQRYEAPLREVFS
ncbi:MAG: Na+/H+ antiporter subunit E [Halothiobacillaceae bacterium]